MKFSPKCNTASEMEEFVIKFGNFCLYLEKNGPITDLKFALEKSQNNLCPVSQYASHLFSGERGAFQSSPRVEVVLS